MPVRPSRARPCNSSDPISCSLDSSHTDCPLLPENATGPLGLCPQLQYFSPDTPCPGSSLTSA